MIEIPEFAGYIGLICTIVVGLVTLLWITNTIGKYRAKRVAAKQDVLQRLQRLEESQQSLRRTIGRLEMSLEDFKILEKLDD